MSKHLLNVLPELIQQNIISAETADRIRSYYADKQASATNRLFIVFGILGALLTGMGIILIIAHNWDDLSKPLKLVFAFLPLLIGQLACGYSLFLNRENMTLKEAGATFLFFAIASSISIVSQIYNIEGSLSSFLLTWMFLALPVVYVIRSSMTSVLYITGITWYACEVSYFNYPSAPAFWYWLLFFAAIPYYMNLSGRAGNFFHFHTWFLTLSLVISLGTISQHHGTLMFIAYISLLSGFVSMGQLAPFYNQRLITNAFLIVGSLGTIGLLLNLSFEWFWVSLPRTEFGGFHSSPEFYASVILSVFTALLLFRNISKRPWLEVNFKSFAFLIFIVLFITGLKYPFISQVVINVAVFVFAVFTIIDGGKKDSLGILNYGLLILSALIICRFFDTNMTFVIRGLLFIGIGIGFFAANYYMIRKRKGVST